jgi:hypothetical protein
MLDETTLSHLPENVTADIDYALVNTGKLREAAAEGLKISIPTNVPLEAYIELVKDSQPRISEVIDLTLSKAPAEASLLDVSKNVSSINLEIEKLRSTRRYAVFDASMAFYRNNNSLINAALLAGAFGMAGSLFGTCATALGAAGKNIAKKKGWLKDNPSANRLGRMIAQDLQPYTDRMMQVFLGGNAPAVNVLSLRRRIETSTTRLVSKKCKVAAAR